MDRGRRLKMIGASFAIGAGMCVLLCGIAGLFAAAAGLRSTTPAAAIERVLAADRLSTQGTSSPGEVVANMRAIDLAGTPEDFQDAFRQHIEAWERRVAVHAETQAWIAEFAPGPATPDEVLYNTNKPEGASAEAEMRRLAIQRSNANAQQGIQSTFLAVQSVAEKHGARASP
jgi:hypothetical protein